MENGNRGEMGKGKGKEEQDEMGKRGEMEKGRR